MQILENRKDIFGSDSTTGGRLAFPSVAERAICEKRDEIEKTIRWVERFAMDQATVDRTNELKVD